MRSVLLSAKQRIAWHHDAFAVCWVERDFHIFPKHTTELIRNAPTLDGCFFLFSQTIECDRALSVSRKYRSINGNNIFVVLEKRKEAQKNRRLYCFKLHTVATACFFLLFTLVEFFRYSASDNKHWIAPEPKKSKYDECVVSHIGDDATAKRFILAICIVALSIVKNDLRERQRFEMIPPKKLSKCFGWKMHQQSEWTRISQKWAKEHRLTQFLATKLIARWFFLCCFGRLLLLLKTTSMEKGQTIKWYLALARFFLFHSF